MHENTAHRDLYMKKKMLNYLNCLRIWNIWKFIKMLKAIDIKYPHSEFGHIINKKNTGREWKHLP